MKTLLHYWWFEIIFHTFLDKSSEEKLKVQLVEIFFDVSLLAKFDQMTQWEYTAQDTSPWTIFLFTVK